MWNEALDIVVADDNPVLVSVLSEIFREGGHNVRGAADGFFALAEIKDRVPDILLSDLCMPGMSGYELLSVVRRRYPSIRVVAMSGAYAEGSVPTGIPADAFYAKGVSSVAQLVDLVGAVWQGRAHLNRSTAPIWVSELAIDHVDSFVLLVCCPECLRPFTHKTETSEFLPARRTCPHCMTLTEVALVRQSKGTDGTPIAIVSAERGKGQLFGSFEPTKESPSERMHQQ